MRILARGDTGQVTSTKEAARIAAARVAHSDVVAPTDDRRDIPRPPGPRGGALIARFLAGGDVPGFFVDLTRQYPHIAHLRLLGEHLYVLNDPDVIVEVFHSHGRDTMKGRGLQSAKALLGNGLLTSEGEVHMRQRRLVQPAFHRDRIAGYADDMVRLTEQHLAAWRPDTDVDMATDMGALTLAVVGRTLFGTDLTGDAAEVGEALNEVLGGLGSRLILGPAMLRMPTRGRRRALVASQRLDAVVQRMIDEHRSSGDTGDMLSMLIAAQEDGVGMTDAQVRDEAMTLVLAGHETTAMALSWAQLLLSRNPAQRRWLQDEVDAVLGDGTPSAADVGSLHRTRAVIAETMRLYPPAWIMGRRLLVDLEVDGWPLPAGAIVLASPYAQHRDPRWWRSSLAFRPDRWLDADGAYDETAPGQPRGAWFPFGWGNRRCIGDGFAWMEATLVLAMITRSWEPSLVPGSDVRPHAAVTLRPAPALPMTLRRR